jgi:hypothetical protein
MIKNKKIFLGTNEADFSEKKVSGKLLQIGDETFYKISHFDEMRPFFMTVVSHSNHWMFISSTGGLSAGRKDCNSALFPYYTDDKITSAAETTGSKTLFLVSKEDKTSLWEPFSDKYAGIYRITRNLYKNAFGNKIIFEEINHDLALKFTYQWNSSDHFGFIKKSTITNEGGESVTLSLIDGIQNLLPYGVEQSVQSGSSNLVDAYKKCELETDSGMGIFSLSAIIVDRAEPSEALKASVVWSLGLDQAIKLLSSKQLDTFRRGGVLTQEEDVKAEKGAYFLHDKISLSAKEEKNWLIAADVNQSISGIIDIKEKLKSKEDLLDQINKDIEAGSMHLLELVGAADGLRLSAHRPRNIRHFSNTMFNIMRGGIFDQNYQVGKIDFLEYLSKANKNVFAEKKVLLDKLSEVFDLNDLRQVAENESDADFKRLCTEYLPLMFSRRHGDPSRPWNQFSINTKSEVDGSKILDYQGNWRDLFQNWEALAYSYPEFIEGMIHKFLNATTFDGYNPYRVTKDGFDWETIEPGNPWAYIGYWGDHQIIYLLKFLEFIENYYPNKLAESFSKNLFVYANVPYLINDYEDLLENPKDTIVFDYENEARIQAQRAKIGADGALLTDVNDQIYKVNFIEKVLATILAKMSNFIPEGGIWMNTQRPEWNDANNALVGNGVSMVTLYYLKRFLKFFDSILSKYDREDIEISIELKQFLSELTHVLAQNQGLLRGNISDKERKRVLDGLGSAGSSFRKIIYTQKFSGQKVKVQTADITSFVDLSSLFLAHSIKANKRTDHLYHAYNLMTVKGQDEVAISYLPEMLEGQVAVLSSGFLSSSESLEVLDALKSSSLFRADQFSYVLYPNKTLPRFVMKNTIPPEAISSSDLLTKLIEHKNNQVVERDALGGYHFNGAFNNVNSLKAALESLPEMYQASVEGESEALYQIFEGVFDHKSFTGRSGTFFGYEGLGSIYWHMVSKLLLATFEITKDAVNQKEDKTLVGRLFDHYFEINEGIGVNKSPELYGAFSTDAYSHTPGGKGAQQPGMTGQVKEDLLSRWGELGIEVQEGILTFDPFMLRRDEFLTKKQDYVYVNVLKERCSIELEKDSIGFTYCQVLIIYQTSQTSKIEVHYNDGAQRIIEGNQLDLTVSRMIFKRTHEIHKLVVFLMRDE